MYKLRKLLTFVTVFALMWPAGLISTPAVPALAAQPCEEVDYTGNPVPSYRFAILIRGLTTENKDGNGFNDWLLFKNEVKDLYDGFIYFSYKPDSKFYAAEDTGAHLTQHIDTLNNLIETCRTTLGSSLSSIDLFGHSLGGAVALGYLKQHQNDANLIIRNLITINSPVNGSLMTCVMNWGSEACRYGATLQTAELYRDYLIAHFGLLVDSDAARDIGQLYKDASLLGNNIDFAKNILQQKQIDVLTITDERDPIVPYLEGAIPGFDRTINSGLQDPRMAHGAAFKENMIKKVHGLIRPKLVETNLPNNPLPPEGNGNNNADFIADVTISDNTQIRPNQTFEKTWRLKNIGTSVWNSQYKLKFNNGNQLWSNAFAPVTSTVNPGEEVNLTVKLTAPAAVGTYSGYWRMADAAGNQFGDLVWIKIKVDPTASAIGIGTGEVKLFTSISYSPAPGISYGTGPSNAPSGNSYSMEIPPGWSVKTYREDNQGGTPRCWTESVPNLQDHDNWQNAIQSLVVFNYNACSGGSKVKLYKNTNYQVQALEADAFTNAPNKDTYSLEIPSGWSVKTYDQDNRNGGQRCWSSSVPNLQDHGWHNQIASMDIFYNNICGDQSNAVELCAGTGYSSCYSTKIESNYPSLQAMGFGNDNLRSIKVTGDWEVVLYSDDNYGGAHKIKLTGSNSDLNSTDIDYNTSSIQVRKRQPTRVSLNDNPNLTDGNPFTSDRSISNLADWGFNDVTESVRVDPGFEVILCSDANYRGTCGRTNTNRNNVNDVASGLANGVSSVQVCEGACPPASMVPIIATPVNEASFLPGSDVVFTWIGNGDEYYIEYWGGNLSSALNSGGIAGTSTTWTKSGLPASSNPYFWHIRSWTQYGETGWSPTYSFKVQDIAPLTADVGGLPTADVNVDTLLLGFVNPLDANNLTYTWSPAPKSGQGTLNPVYNWNKAGTYNISLIAQNTGGSVTGNFTVTVKCPDGQYLAEYYNNAGLGGSPEFTRCESTIDYDWGHLGPVDTFDGNLTVASGQTKLINTERAALAVTANASQRDLTTSSSALLQIGDEVMILQVSGTGAGNYEFKRISQISGNVITVAADLTNTYTVGTDTKAQLVRVPHYDTVTVENTGVLTTDRWNYPAPTGTGGVLVFRAKKIDIKAGGKIDTTRLGFFGGRGGLESQAQYPDTGDTGGSYPKDSSINGNIGGDCGGCISPAGTPNGGAGRGGRGARGGDSAGGGAGGSYRTVGEGGATALIWPNPQGGYPGNTYGVANLSQIFFGSGGGGGGKGKDGYGGQGGAGGGIIFIQADEFINQGQVLSNGENGVNNASENGGGGGGGAGGSIFINARTINTVDNAIKTLGGTGGVGNLGGYGYNGGFGGEGRVHVEYCDSLAGTLSAGTDSAQVTCNHDNFSIRWTGNINFPTAAEYKFTTSTDDGVRLWVDGEQLVNSWVAASGDKVGNKTLTAGLHEVKMEYYEAAGDARAKLTIEQLATPNNPPVVTQIPGQSINTSQTFTTFDLDNYGSDPDAGDSLTWSYTGNGDLTVGIDTDKIVTITKPANWTGTQNITFTATDTHNATANSTTAFTVNPADTCPGQFSAKYFNNTDLSGTPVLTRCEDFIDNYWWEGQGPGSGVNTDYFSARWEGNINFAAGNYTFHTSSDNGVKVWVDGNLVIDNWTAHSWENDNYTLDLTAGVHNIKMEYYENQYDAVAALTWYWNGGNCNNIPTGLYCVEYYNNNSLAGSPVFTALKSNISYDWGSWGPDNGITDNDAFSIRWLGNFNFNAGVYEFGTSSDDGAKVWIDNVQVVDHWGPHGLESVYPSVNVAAGAHTIKGEYREIGGNAAVWFYYAPINNNAPAINTIPGQTVVPGQNFAAFDLDTYGSDPDINDPVTWSYSNNGPLTVNIDTNNVATVTTPANWTGEQNITFTATDTHSATANGSALFKVTAADPCPGQFNAEYFNNINLTGTPVLTRCENFVDNYWWGNESPAAEVNSDFFSARWVANWNFAAGNYTFHTSSDDGVRVWVDGNLIIDNWDIHGWENDDYNITLSAGLHNIKMEYFDDDNDAVAALTWYWNGGDCNNIPTDLYCVEYFNNSTLSGAPTFTALKRDISYDWGGWGPGNGITNDDAFSLRWRGNFAFDAGVYEFGASSDDGVRVWLDNILVVDDWGPHGLQSVFPSVSVTAGTHQIKGEFREVGGGASVWYYFEEIANNAPVVNTIPGQTIALGQSFTTFDLDTYGSDPDIADPITWSYSGNSALTVSIDSGNVVTVTTPQNWTGEQNITFTATDSHNAAASKTALFKVNNNTCVFNAQYWNNTTLNGTPVLTRCEDNIQNFWWGNSPAAGVNANNFSARWQGDITFTTAGTYKFVATSDAGVKVWVDNTLVINNWTAHTVKFNSADVTLTAGVHNIKMEYYETTGDALASLSWILPQTQTSNCSQLGKFCAKYFNNTSLSGTPVLSMLTSTVDYGWNGAPGAGINSDNFSARYEGQFEFTAGNYEFMTGSDDGVRVWVDGNLIIDNWSAHGYEEDWDTVAMTAGVHDIKVEFYEEGGSAVVWLGWWEE